MVTMPPVHGSTCCFFCFGCTLRNTPLSERETLPFGVQIFRISSSRAKRRFKEFSIPSFATMLSALAMFPSAGAACGRWYWAESILDSNRALISSKLYPAAMSSISAPRTLFPMWHHPVGAVAVLHHTMFFHFLVLRRSLRISRNHVACGVNLSPRYKTPVPR